MASADAQLGRLDAIAIRDDLTAPELQRAVGALNAVTGKVSGEAAHLGQAATAVAAAAKVVALASQALGILAMPA